MDENENTAPEDAGEDKGSELEALVAPFREKYKGRIQVFDLPSEGWPEHPVVIIAKPTNPEVYRTYTRELRNPNLDDVVVIENFAFALIVHPADPKAKRAILNDLGGFAQVVAGAGEKLCGIGIKAAGKA